MDKHKKNCELFLDHNPVWGGDGYFCSNCELRFIPVFPTPEPEKERRSGACQENRHACCSFDPCECSCHLKSSTPDWREFKNIEGAYPEAYRLAREFHKLYEKFAPQFGYETRKETKEFNAESPNGRLMAYVCWNFIASEKSKLEEEMVREHDDTIQRGMKLGVAQFKERVLESVSRLTVYYRSKFSIDCSRGESREETQTEMWEKEEVAKIIKEVK